MDVDPREELEIRRRLLAKGYRDCEVGREVTGSGRDGTWYLVALPEATGLGRRQLRGTYAALLYKIAQLPDRAE